MQVDLFKGYSRTWAEYPVLVMIIKIFITMGVIFLLSAKIRQASPLTTTIMTTHVSLLRIICKPRPQPLNSILEIGRPLNIGAKNVYVCMRVCRH